MDVHELLNDGPTFIIGYLIGVILIFMTRRFFKERLYFERLWAAIQTTFTFFKELILSNISVLSSCHPP